ncbi:ribonuclease Z [Haloarchaeobius iranensis]|uniref:Ribonuclease Z n=1 Tax=Haloarchaeobius iranensis TaxID=996166 RepID=A0A1G9SBV0_9EURY|nr:ribonuclease Z [Haloarchaeobius iranensis]SDM32958.1 ribonuclease Z [Haloarchaeobius iranensis]
MSMRVTFLGTSGAVPTTQRNPTSLYCQREGDAFLFDCGEGTQRQMMRFGTGFSVDHIFVTHTHGDHVLGIPGLVQTMDFNERDAALAIHCPPGEKPLVERLINATGARPSFPVRVHEVSAGDVALRREEYEVRAFEVEHRTTAVGYALVEDDRKGRFDRERAEELGVPVGPKFSELHEGNAVELDDGTVISPDQVVGDPRPGRRFVFTGDSRPVDATVEAAEQADLLVHDATFAEDRRDRAGQTGHSTAKQAGEVAQRAGAKRLALTHVSSRYANDVKMHRTEAREAFDGEVLIPDDGDTVEIPYPDGE